MIDDTAGSMDDLQAMAAHTVTVASPESFPWWLDLSDQSGNCPKQCAPVVPLSPGD
jgi:hypothetical protein